jgi:hypothetical protein
MAQRAAVLRERVAAALGARVTAARTETASESRALAFPRASAAGLRVVVPESPLANIATVVLEQGRWVPMCSSTEELRSTGGRLPQALQVAPVEDVR